MENLSFTLTVIAALSQLFVNVWLILRCYELNNRVIELEKKP